MTHISKLSLGLSASLYQSPDRDIMVLDYSKQVKFIGQSTRGRLEIPYQIHRTKLFYLFSHKTTNLQVSPDGYSFMTDIKLQQSVETHIFVAY